MQLVANGSSNCEMAIFSHALKGIPSQCETVSVNAEHVWSNLHAKNAYLFTTTVKTTFKIICEEKTTICEAEGTGIIQLNPRCIIQSLNYEIVSETTSILKK